MSFVLAVGVAIKPYGLTVIFLHINMISQRPRIIRHFSEYSMYIATTGYIVAKVDTSRC